MKKAKHFNSAIDNPIFSSIPLSQVRINIFKFQIICTCMYTCTTMQVCPPGLQISLGIFLRLYNLLEEACTKLNLCVVLQGAGGDTYHRYVKALMKLSVEKEKLERTKRQVEGLEQVGVLFSLFLPNPPSASPMYVPKPDKCTST